MELIESPQVFAATLDRWRAGGSRVGLVPTMGALHRGHRSLIAAAAADCDAVAVTVFVNPLQFDDADDLQRYPRTLPEDMSVAAGAGARLVFAPTVLAMYPDHPAPLPTTVHVAGVGDRLEGVARPGHLDGVATVVAKLLALAGRCRAYFGEKDFQQLAVVRQLTRDLSFPAEIVGCPTVREPDGLALSSRNTRLSPSGREAATCLHRALQAGRAAVAAGERQVDVVEQAMAAVVAAEPRARLDYAVAVDPASLQRPAAVGRELRLLVAAVVDGVRLIDNLAAPIPGVHRPTQVGPPTQAGQPTQVGPPTQAEQPVAAGGVHPTASSTTPRGALI